MNWLNYQVLGLVDLWVWQSYKAFAAKQIKATP